MRVDLRSARRRGATSIVEEFIDDGGSFIDGKLGDDGDGDDDNDNDNNLPAPDL